MLVRQSKNTFIRHYDGECYFTNQMISRDRTYIETGSDFLKEISGTSKDIEEIIDHLSKTIVLCAL